MLNLTTVLFSSYATAFNALITAAKARNQCTAKAALGGSVAFSPAGGDLFTVPGNDGHIVVQSCNLSGQAGGLINGQFALMATSYLGGSGGAPSLSDLHYEIAGTTDDNNMVPWYDMSVSMSGSGDDTLVGNYCTAWNLSITNQIEPVFTLCNGTSGDPRTPKTLRLGMMEIKGSVTIYSPTGNLANQNVKRSASLSLSCPALTLAFPNCVICNSTANNNGENDMPLKTISFEALADCDGNSMTLSTGLG
jgi:hypothetical protein